MTWPSTLFRGRRYAVLGLGRNGLPAARTLLAMGAEVVAWDDRDQPDGLTLRDPAAEIASFDALVLSPGIPHVLPQPHPTAAAAIAAGIPVLSDADLLFQAVRAAGSQARFIGVTGTNGKSTTTALIAHILAEAGREVAAGGNLGPASLALPLLGHNGLYVLEKSSYMLERIGRIRFDAAVMLNLSPPIIWTAMGTWKAMQRPSRRSLPASTRRTIWLWSAPMTTRVPQSAAARRAKTVSPASTRPIITAKTACCRTMLAQSCGCMATPALPGPHNCAERRRRRRRGFAFRRPPGADRRQHRQFPRPAAPPAARRRRRWRALCRRQQGDQRRRRRPRAGLLRAHRLDRRRRVEGRRHRPARATLPADRPRFADRPGRARTRRASSAPCRTAIPARWSRPSPPPAMASAQAPRRGRRAAQPGLRQLRPVQRL